MHAGSIPGGGGEGPLEEGLATRSSAPAGESRGPKSLAGCSPGGRTAWDTTERLSSGGLMFPACPARPWSPPRPGRLSAACSGCSACACSLPTVQRVCAIIPEGLCAVPPGAQACPTLRPRELYLPGPSVHTDSV